MAKTLKQNFFKTNVIINVNLVFFFLCDMCGINQSTEGKAITQHDAILLIQNMKHTNIQTERQSF